MNDAVARFVEGMLRLIRSEFFENATDKRFFQERLMLVQAITWPAKWMHQRGAKAPASVYRQILGTVIRTIREKGHVAQIRRFSVYFLHSVQEHMKHHGDQYYYMVKAAKPISSILPKVIDRGPVKTPPHPTWCHCARCDPTEILAQINRAVRSPGGRRRRAIPASQPELLPTFPPARGGKHREAP